MGHVLIFRVEGKILSIIFSDATNVDHFPCCTARFRSGKNTKKRMDQALAAVNGSFVLAAKLLDMRPNTFRGLVFYHPELRLKWGHKRTGRPPGCPRLLVQAFKDTPAHRVARKPIDFIFEIVDCLPRERQLELLRWLDGKLSSPSAIESTND